ASNVIAAFQWHSVPPSRALLANMKDATMTEPTPQSPPHRELSAQELDAVSGGQKAPDLLMNTCRGILVMIGVTMMLAACAQQPDVNQASARRSRSQAGVLMTEPSGGGGGGGGGGAGGY